ncbi:MAG: tRNA (adenosine(37)-N6)-threonylcarbamoyltransferase complex dimerization subunit type 1 TsaB [Gammaproteobacteria bacterium]|nr:tRNA (adenosine(37)-N6)-threonylcarbamoyltransferase complex dimerization subunit type 1 TsaB [Gammaproteobacteria bacterium]
MTRILALDTATEACSVALLDGARVYKRYKFAPREHAQLVLSLVAEVLAEAGLALKDLDALAFGCGPGGFTGVRIATGVVQGLAFALDKPVLAVSTLRALAQGMARRHGATAVAAAIDARMGEVYFGAYRADERGIMRLAGEERVCAPEAVTVPAAEGWNGVGSGFGAYGERLSAVLPGLAGVDAERFPEAEDILPLAAADFAAGLAVPADLTQPVYLRDKVADKPAPR